MVIASVNSVNTVSNNIFKIRNEKVTNPIINKQPENQNTNSDGGALRSYFLGRSAISFKGFGCSTSDFAVKKLDDVPCCCCGDKMIRGIMMPEKASELAEHKGPELAAKIREDKEYFRSAQRAVAMIMADEIDKNPSLGLSEAMSASKNGLPQKVAAYCTGIMQNVAAAATEAYGSEKNPATAMIARETARVKEGNIGRIAFTEQLAKLKGTLSQEAYGKIEDAAMELPESMSAVNKVYKKALGRSDYEVADRLLKGALHTAEHVHPKSLGGPNATSNYLGECALCNNPRGSMSYAQWLKVHPEYPRKVQDHIEYVEQKIVDGEIPPSYDDYPIDINKTLTKESNGVMTLKVLNPEKIRELRERKKAGEEVSVREETAKLYGEDKEEEKAKKAA